MNSKKIVVFASGSGSNAENIYNYFQKEKLPVSIAAIFTNNPDAYVIERAKKLNIPCIVFDRTAFKQGDVLEQVNNLNPDLIVLAGFLWLIPAQFVQSYPNKIINIHPALLPKFGGKGMYGDRVHQAIIESGATETGITIHYVNEEYDEGNIIFQEQCEVLPNDTPSDVAEKVHALEYAHFPHVIADLLR